MIIKSKAGTEIAKNGYTVIDELNQIPMIKTNYLQLEHNHINPIIIGSKSFEHKDIFVNVVEDTETSGNTAFKEYNAIHEFAWILSGMRKHDSYTGYLSLEQYLTMVLEGTDFTYQVEGGHQYYALQFENLGDGESHLDMFFKMLSRWNTEFELRGKKVYITHQRGRLRDKHVGRYKMNIIDTIINSDITDGATAVWGYFGKKDEENPENSTYREFYWQIDELVEQYGIRYAKPYSNENITQEETMIEYLNNILLDSWKISTEVDIAEITDEVAQTGDEYVAVDERLGITLNTRIQKLESVYDADDKLLYQTATLGTVSFASTSSGSSSQLQEVIEKIKKDYNDRITDLKQEFDNRFNDEVTQIEIDFNELVNGVRQEIQADYDAMSNDFEQMKLEQQQRVDEIYEDIGSINQTVSDVADKADYLDGVYTDLSTQTGEVSSTVANIIDGKAPAGSVLKQTIDGVVGRVWENDIVGTENDNLLRNSFGDDLTDWVSWYSDLSLYSSPILSAGDTWIRVNKQTRADYGVTTPPFKLKANETYVISFDFRGFSSGYNLDYLYLREGKSTITTIKKLPNVYIPDNQLSGDIATDGGRIYFTFSHDTDLEFARILIGIQSAPEISRFTIKRVKITNSNLPTPYTRSSLDSLKHTDLVLKSDGFMLGTFEMGGDKIAQAILGKAGAIDLIADNVNLSNNLNVANQIKSLSLETVYANISELRTRLLVADVITADMVKFDTALIEKFTSSTAFINSLTAKSAFINNAKVTELISTDGRDSFTLAGGQMNWTRSNGQSMQLGIDGIYMKNSDGSTRFQLDRTLVASSALGTTFSNVYLGAEIDGEARVVQARDIPGDGLPESYRYLPIRALALKSPPNAHLYLGVDGSELRVMSPSLLSGGIYRSVRMQEALVTAIRINQATNAQNLYLSPVPGGEVRITHSADSQYARLRALDLRANELYPNTGNNLYLRSVYGNEVHVMNGGGDVFGTLRAGTLIYSSLTQSSLESLKKNINPMRDNVLELYKNELELYSFAYNTNPHAITYGVVIGKGYKVPKFWLKDGKVKVNDVIFHNSKAIQELAHENDTLKDRINDLENKLNKIMEMIA